MFLFSFIFLKKEKDWKGGEFNRAPLTKKNVTVLKLCLVNIQNISLSADYSACNVKQLT